MSAPRSFIYDGALRSWDIHDSEPQPGLHASAYFGEVVSAVHEMRPSLELTFVLTRTFGAAPALRGDDVVVICVEDELARVPAYAPDVRLVVKAYGVQRSINVNVGAWATWPFAAVTLIQEVRAQVLRAPSLVSGRARSFLRGRRPNIVDVPPGTYLAKEMPWIPFDGRTFDVWFSGSVTNEEDLSRSWTARFRQKTRAREAFLKALHAFRVARPDIPTYEIAIDSFHWASDWAGQYSESLMRSRIALCPRGNSLETYRVLEALRSGCVIVAERLPRRDYYSESPFVWVRDWRDLPAIVDRLLADRAQLEARHRASVAWWENHLSPRAIARRILTALERV